MKALGAAAAWAGLPAGPHARVDDRIWKARHRCAGSVRTSDMATTVGLIQLTVHVAQATNLKEKRRVLKSFKDRLRNGYNVSVSEVDGQDSRRRAVLAIAMVGSDKRYIEGRLQKIINMAAAHRDMILLDHEIEWL